MLSRALSLAAVLLLIGSFASMPALAQENLDAGKTPSQIFSATCNACHKSPRGLLKTVSPSSLPGFLRQHYTTSPNMAGALASYLVSNGATDTRIGGDGPKGAKGAKEGAKQEAKQEPRSSPGGPPQQLDRWGRPVHQAPAQQEASPPASEEKPEAAEAQPDRGPDGRKLSPKQKLSKRGKPGEKEEPPTAPAEPKVGEKSEPKGSEAAAAQEGKSDTGKSDTGKSDTGKSDTGKSDTGKSEAPKSADQGRSQSAKIEQPPEPVTTRPDPVPQVMPAGSGNAGTPTQGGPAQGASAPALTAPAQSPPMQAAISAPTTEMAVPLNAAPPPPPPPALTASAPALPPVQPAGPPVPPISQ
jgi:hypothetical protein